MPYALEADIVALYGQRELDIVADLDGDGTADTDAVARAIEAAEGEVNTHLAARYALPLPSVPAILKQLTVDVALYRLAGQANARTEEHRTRYEDAVAMLKRVAEGKAELPFEADPNADPENPFTGQGPDPVVIEGPARIFTREKMRGL